MPVNYCPNCGKKREEGETLCFNCGLDLSRFDPPKGGLEAQLQDLMNRFIKDNPEFIRDMVEKFHKGETPGKGMFFSVEMDGEKPTVRSGDIKDMEKIMEDLPLPSFVKNLIRRDRKEGEGDEAVETECCMAETSERKTPDGTEVEVKMPGVTSEDEVEVNIRDGNLEIVGRSGKTLYFAEVPMDRHMGIRRHRIRDGALLIDLWRMD